MLNVLLYVLLYYVIGTIVTLGISAGWAYWSVMRVKDGGYPLEETAQKLSKLHSASKVTSPQNRILRSILGSIFWPIVVPINAVQLIKYTQTLLH